MTGPAEARRSEAPRLRSVLAITGLTKEAHVAAGPGVTAVAGGGNRAALEARLGALDPSVVSAVVSFGLAGGLDPTLAVGDVLLAKGVLEDGQSTSTSIDLTDALARQLSAGRELYRVVTIASVDAPLLDSASKSKLRTFSGADAVDMESHVAGAFAAAHGLPFTVLRVVSDGADHTLPAAAGAAMRSDGSIDVGAVLTRVARDPRQIPALLTTGRNAALAFRKLSRVRGLLGRGLGLNL